MSTSTFQEKINPLQNLSPVDEVERWVRRFLVENEPTPGDLLAKEVDLAEAFRVSRTATSRETGDGVERASRTRAMED